MGWPVPLGLLNIHGFPERFRSVNYLSSRETVPTAYEMLSLEAWRELFLSLRLDGGRRTFDVTLMKGHVATGPSQHVVLEVRVTCFSSSVCFGSCRLSAITNRGAMRTERHSERNIFSLRCLC